MGRICWAEPCSPCVNRHASVGVRIAIGTAKDEKLPAKYTNLLTARLDNRIVLLFFVVGVLILGLCIWFFQDTSEQSRRDAEAYRIEFKARRLTPDEVPRMYKGQSAKKSPGKNTTPE
jgi:hypothetical protein